MYSHAHKTEVTAIIFAQRWTKKFFVHFSNKAVKTMSPSPTTPAAIPVVAIKTIGFFQAVMQLNFCFLLFLSIIFLFKVYFHNIDIFVKFFMI